MSLKRGNSFRLQIDESPKTPFGGLTKSPFGSPASPGGGDGSGGGGLKRSPSLREKTLVKLRKNPLNLKLNKDNQNVKRIKDWENRLSIDRYESPLQS